MDECPKLPESLCTMHTTSPFAILKNQQFLSLLLAILYVPLSDTIIPDSTK